ncbi:hypothetical protein JHK85_010293 [Glycine max]|nr:hypothetical protein JHK85_010293 [Glycine max]
MEPGTNERRVIGREVPGMGFEISQLGSSVATSLIDGESKLKHDFVYESKRLKGLGIGAPKGPQTEREMSLLVETMRSKLEDTRQKLVASDNKVRQLETQVHEKKLTIGNEMKGRKRGSDREEGCHGEEQCKGDEGEGLPSLHTLCITNDVCEREVMVAINSRSSHKQPHVVEFLGLPIVAIKPFFVVELLSLAVMDFEYDMERVLIGGIGDESLTLHKQNDMAQHNRA